MLVEGQVGPQVTGDGAINSVRAGRLGDVIVSELHGRFYEQAYRGNVYMGGMTLTSINAATFTSATTGATATPIAGVWNPSTSPVNLVMLQAVLGVTITAATATGGGPYVWMVVTANAAITTGAVPFNAKTLAQSGSFAKNMAGVALTGLTGTLSIVGGSACFGGSAEGYSFVSTAAGAQTIQISSVENFDGGLIVPPGGILALMATTTPAAHSAASLLKWEEVPVA